MSWSTRCSTSTIPELIDALLWQDQDDATQALAVAIEGDALRYGFEALGIPHLPEPSTLRDELAGAGLDGALGRAPALLRLSLLVPYIEGYRLSYTEGPALRERPPLSTEQALHPERRYEPFLAYDLRALRTTLPGGCRFVSENSMGELGISILMRDLADAPVDPEAWYGWNGDRYVTARCDGRRAFVWISAWDSESDAAAFEAAYRGIADAVAERGELTRAPQTRRHGPEVVAVSEALAPLVAELDALASRRTISTLQELLATEPPPEGRALPRPSGSTAFDRSEDLPRRWPESDAAGLASEPSSASMLSRSAATSNGLASSAVRGSQAARAMRSSLR